MDPEVVDRETVFSGKLIKVRVDTWANGVKREVVVHPGAAAVAAVDDDDRIVLVRQYRHGAGRHLLEVPAGILEAGEDPIECARRELAEETGFRAGTWQHLFTTYSSPGYVTERIHLFRAGDLKATGSGPDPSEIDEVEVLPLRTAWLMVRDGRIQDAKTIAAIASVLWTPGRERQ